jgi:hypothetical protein
MMALLLIGCSLLILVGLVCLAALIWQDFGPRPEPPWPASPLFGGLVEWDDR